MKIIWYMYFLCTDVYHNCEDVVPLIIELINEVVQKQLCYLGEVNHASVFTVV